MASKEAASDPSALESRSRSRLATSGVNARRSSLRAKSMPPRAMESPARVNWWNSSSTLSACSDEMAVILATSRLTVCTSSSPSCCNRSALDCSPSTMSSRAALRTPGRDSAFAALTIIGHLPQPSVSVLPNPTLQDVGGEVRIFLDLFAQMFGQDFGRLGDRGRELQGTQRLSVQLLL